MREMGKPELAYHTAEAIRHFQTKKSGFEIAEKYYEKAASDSTLTTRINVSKAQFLGRLGKVDKAIPLIEAALSENKTDTDINRVAGMLWLAQNEGAAVYNSDKVQKARKSLIRAMQLNPDNIPAHYYYAKSFQTSSGTPSKQAVASAQTSLDYYRSSNFVDRNTGLAHVLIKADELEYAVPTLQKAVSWSRSSSVRSYSRNQLKRLQAAE